MTVFEYPVTQGYGYDPNYKVNNGVHTGIDYGAPYGFPVIVNGVMIGLVGATGETYDAQGNKGTVAAAHLHVGRFVDGQMTDPGISNGGSLDNAIVYDTGYDDTNGNYVRVSGSGALWVYLHLSEIDVTKGQKLEGEVMNYPNAGDIKNVGDRNHQWGQDANGNPTPNIIAYWTTGTGNAAWGNPNDVWTNLIDEVGAWDEKWATEHATPSQYKPVTEQLYKKG